MAKSFPILGARGESASATNMRRKGIEKFETFLQEKGLPSFSELTVEHLVVELIQEFGGYLCFEASKDDGDLFAWESITKFISGVKTVCCEDVRFKHLDMWKEGQTKWYTMIREGCYRNVVLRCIKEGKPLSMKSTPLGRKYLRDLATKCIELSNGRGDFMMKRWVFINAFLAVGRTGEIADATWGSSYWEPDSETPYILWNERKVAKQSYLNFFADAEFYEIDWYHSLASYLLFGGGSAAYMSQYTNPDRLESPLCAELSSLKETSVATQINVWLKDISKQIDGFPKGSSGTSFRIGAANVMANHPTTELIHVILRGGWDFTGVTNAFEYLLQLSVSLSIGGKALCGVPNSRANWYPPRAVFINDDNVNIVKIYNFKLFGDLVYNLGEIQDIIFTTCMCSLLMHLKKFISDFGISHILVIEMVKKAADVNIDLDTLLEWGQRVRDDWVHRNCMASTGDATDLCAKISTLHLQNLSNSTLLQSRLINLENENVKLSKSNKDLESKLDEMLGMQSEILRYIRQNEIASYQSPSSSIKAPASSPTSSRHKKRKPSGVGSPDPPPIVEQAVNPLELLRSSASYNVNSLADVTVMKLLDDWYRYKMFIDSNWQATKGNRDRVRKVMAFVHDTVASAAELEIFQSPEPDQKDILWVNWREAFNKAAQDVSGRVFVSLGQLEKDLDLKVVQSRGHFVNSAYERLQTIKKAQPKAATIDDSKLSTRPIEKFFARK